MWHMDSVSTSAGCVEIVMSGICLNASTTAFHRLKRCRFL